MQVDLQKFTRLYTRLCDIDFTGTIAGVRPSIAGASAIQAAMAKGTPVLPLTYQQSFAGPLGTGLQSILAILQQAVSLGQIPQARATNIIESFYAPIYEHGDLSRRSTSAASCGDSSPSSPTCFARSSTRTSARRSRCRS